MSARDFATVWLPCHCGAENPMQVEQTSKGCRASHDAWTGWSPPEPPEYEVTGPSECVLCGADLDGDDVRNAAIFAVTGWTS